MPLEQFSQWRQPPSPNGRKKRHHLTIFCFCFQSHRTLRKVPSNVRTTKHHIAAARNELRCLCKKQQNKWPTFRLWSIWKRWMNAVCGPGQERGRHKILLFSILLWLSVQCYYDGIYMRISAVSDHVSRKTELFRNFHLFITSIVWMGVCVSPLYSLFCLMQPTVIHTRTLARAYMIVLCANINAHIMIFAQQNMYTNVRWCCFHSCPVDYYDNSRFWKLHTLTHTHWEGRQ